MVFEGQRLRFEPADFEASFRGHTVAAPIVRFDDVQHVGLLIADKQAGPFRTELHDINAE